MSTPRWIARIIWTFRGKRRVRIHLEVKPETPVSTIDGVLVGRWAGHYILLMPRAVVGEDKSQALDGTVEIPADRVLFVQVLA